MGPRGPRTARQGEAAGVESSPSAPVPLPVGIAAFPGKPEWRALVRERLATLDVKAIRADVGPFLERPGDANLLTRENLQGLVQG